MDVTTICEKFEKFRLSDLERQDLTQLLLSRVQQLEIELQERICDLENEKRSRRTYQEQVEKHFNAVSRHQFVHVIIDGDGYIFNEKYLRDVDTGGIEAAHALRSAIKEYVQDSMKEAPVEYEIMGTVLANKQGLAKAVADSPKLNAFLDMESFFCKFSQSQPLFQFVDCGAGKERADSKLRAMYRHFVYNTQCLRVFLACCHDNGYVAELAQYQRDTVAQSKTVLIEHAQQGKQYKGLPFESTSFGRLFMRESLSADAPTRPITKPLEALDLGNEEAMQAFSYSQVAKDFGLVLPGRTKSSSHSPIQSTAIGSIDGSSSGEPTTRPIINDSPAQPTDIPVNKHGQRVDRKLSPPSDTESARFEHRILKKKLCNEFHLRGSCYNRSCPYDHKEIDEGLKLALRYTARKHPCNRGKQCRRPNCYNAHHCPFGSTCRPFKCRFAQQDMHDVDLVIEKYVPALAVDDHY